MSTTKKKTAASIVWFEVPADNVERARAFYGGLFGWKITPFAGASANVPEYWHIDTGGGDDTPDGGMFARCHPKQTITNYINVPSLTRSLAKLKKLGGKVCTERTAVPGRGYFVICEDTEGSAFALWEINARAK